MRKKEKEINNIEFYNLLNYSHADLWRAFGGEEVNIYRDLIIGYINKHKASN